ncbi:hypothetical protein HBI62_193070 [Parastagonospora nodorum]|nr:hypothetical protein HBI62_193070 [Parastagonospora nodorum]KAH6144311.1 hypothetical protein HBI63_179790 [Parastagonospora nodorum]
MSTREGGGLRDKRADAALVLSEISILRPQTLQEPLNQPDWEHCRQIARKSSRFVDFCSYTSSGGLLTTDSQHAQIKLPFFQPVAWVVEVAVSALAISSARFFIQNPEIIIRMGKFA